MRQTSRCSLKCRQKRPCSRFSSSVIFVIDFCHWLFWVSGSSKHVGTKVCLAICVRCYHRKNVTKVSLRWTVGDISFFSRGNMFAFSLLLLFLYACFKILLFQRNRVYQWYRFVWNISNKPVWYWSRRVNLKTPIDFKGTLILPNIKTSNRHTFLDLKLKNPQSQWVGDEQRFA